MFSLLLSAHQSCIHITSKEMVSKSKCIIEFTLHTWMKYLFIYLIPHEKCSRGVCVWICYSLCGSQHLSVIPGCPADFQKDEMISYHLLSVIQPRPDVSVCLREGSILTHNQTSLSAAEIYVSKRFILICITFKLILSYKGVILWLFCNIYKLFKHAVLFLNPYIYLICSSAIDLSFKCNFVRDHELNLHSFLKTLHHRYRCFMISWSA